MRRTRIGAAGAAMVMLAGAAGAATYTWTGGAGDGLFSTPGNWDGGAAPVAATTADNLVFTTAGTADNDIPNLTVGNVSVTLAAGDQLTITGEKFGGTGTLTKDGAGTLLFSATNAPDAEFSHAVAVNGGIFQVNKTGDFHGALTVAEGAAVVCSDGTVNFRGPVEIDGCATNSGAQVYYYTRVKGNTVGVAAGNTTWFVGGLDGIVTLLGNGSKSGQAVFYADTSCFHGYFRTSGEGTIDGRTGKYVRKSGTIFTGMTSSSVTGGITVDNQPNFGAFGSDVGHYVLITNSDIRVTGAFSAGHPGPRASVQTTLRLGAGTTVTAHTVQTGGQEADTTIRSFGRIELLPGSVVNATNMVCIGYHRGTSKGAVANATTIPRGGTTNEWILVDGGTLNAEGVGVGIGLRAPTCRFYLKDGTVNAEGFYFLAHRNKGASVTDGGIGIGGKNTYRYIQTGGTLNMGEWGFVAYAREDNSEANVILSGGTLNATKDFPIPYYNPTLFGYGNWRREAGEGFTLNTAGHTVTLQTALNGMGDVRLAGNGTVAGTNAMQGVLGGTWTVDGGMTADLRGASSLLGGFSVGPNANVTLDVGAGRSAAFFSRDGSWPLNGTSATVLDRFNESDGGTVATSISHDMGLWNVSGAASVMPTQHGNSRNVILSKGEFYVAPEEAGTWTFSGIYNNRIYIKIDEQSATSAGETSYANIQLNLESGWHRFIVVCEHQGSTCGPNNRTGMAVGFAKTAVNGDAAADYTLFSPKNLKMRPSAPCGGEASVRWSTVKTTAWADTTWQNIRFATYADNWDWDEVSLTNSLKATHFYGAAGSGDPRLTGSNYIANRWDGWFLVPYDKAGTWRFRLKYNNRIRFYLDGEDLGVEAAAAGGEVTGDAAVTPGWHRYEIRTYRYNGSSGPGNNDYAVSYAVKTAADADFGAFVPFDEDSLTLSLAPDGYLQGEIALASGAAVTNVSETAAVVWGDVKVADGAAGAVMSGKFACVSNTVDFGTVAANTSDLSAVLRFDDAATNLFADVGRIAVDFASRPTFGRTLVGPAGGLDALSDAELARRFEVTVDGVPSAEAKCTVLPLVEDGKLYLRNASGTTVIIR